VFQKGCASGTLKGVAASEKPVQGISEACFQVEPPCLLVDDLLFSLI